MLSPLDVLLKRFKYKPSDPSFYEVSAGVNSSLPRSALLNVAESSYASIRSYEQRKEQLALSHSPSTTATRRKLRSALIHQRNVLSVSLLHLGTQQHIQV